MEDPSYSSLKPRRLVMTKMECFYCGKPPKGTKLTEELYGLKHCENHEAAAQRDCNAYLHEYKVVLIKDAYNHEIIGRFLRSIKNGFPVLRSSGEIQSGWKLHELGWEATAIRYVNTDWCIQCLLRSPDGDYTKDILKYVPILNFKMDAIYKSIQHEVPEDFLWLVDQTVLSMIEGVYVKEYEEVQKLQQQEYPELSFTREVVYEGRIGRILIPSAPICEIITHEENPV